MIVAEGQLLHHGMCDRAAIHSCVTALGSTSLEYTFERMGPGIAQDFEWAIDYRAPLILDAESLIAGDLADLVRRHSVLSRTLAKVGKETRRYGDDGTGAAFAEQGGFGNCVVFELHLCTEHAGPRLCTEGGETALRERDRDSAVTEVVHGTDPALCCKGDRALL